MPDPFSPGSRPGTPSITVPWTVEPGASRRYTPNKRARDAAVADGGPRRRDVDARRVAAEVAAAQPVDVEPLDGHVSRADPDHAARSRSLDARAPPSDQMHRLVDEQVAAIGAGARPPRGRRVARRRGAPGAATTARRPGRPSSRPGVDGMVLRRTRPPERPAAGSATAAAVRFTRPASPGPGLSPGDDQRPDEEQRRHAHRVRGRLRIRVDLEVRELLRAEHRRHERVHLHGRRRRQRVAVDVHPVAERPEREGREVDVQHEHVDEARPRCPCTAARRYSRPSAPTMNGSHLNSVKSSATRSRMPM